MSDKKQFEIARARLDALRKNIPSFLDESRVADYHSIVDALQKASGEDLSDFRISESEVKPKLRQVSVTRTGANQEHWYIDRDRIIAELVKRDRALTPPSPSNVVKVEHMHGSSIQQGTQGSNVTINFKAIESDLRTLVNNIKGLANDLGLSEAAKNQLRVDVETLEIQLASQHPKSSILSECLQSIRAIFELVAGHVLAGPILFQINKMPGG